MEGYRYLSRTTALLTNEAIDRCLARISKTQHVVSSFILLLHYRCSWQKLATTLGHYTLSGSPVAVRGACSARYTSTFNSIAGCISPLLWVRTCKIPRWNRYRRYKRNKKKKKKVPPSGFMCHGCFHLPHYIARKASSSQFRRLPTDKFSMPY